jgi:hypothetical protein
MANEVDVKKITLYPPEVFPKAMPINLQTGDNKVDDYMLRQLTQNFIISFRDFSFSPASSLTFKANVDGKSNLVYISDLGNTKGLDYEENIKFVAKDSATFFITNNTGAAVSNYAYRYKVLVLKPTTALKVQLGLPLDKEDERLDQKFNISQQVRLKTPSPFDVFYGIEDFFTETSTLTSSGVVSRIMAPPNKKIILLGISVTRPSAAASGYISITRDNLDTVTSDLYCLPSLSYDSFIRITALTKIEVNFNMTTAGTYKFRIFYGVGRITLEDKVRWNLEMSSSEKEEASSLDLYDKIAAGVKV